MFALLTFRQTFLRLEGEGIQPSPKGTLNARVQIPGNPMWHFGAGVVGKVGADVKVCADVPVIGQQCFAEHNLGEQIGSVTIRLEAAGPGSGASIAQDGWPFSHL
ncbi:hypothetical protein HYR54_11860 [Candidatus Acetothermia bacterium]|nr:hypothetical protein [Candidatus Acetothermia bacterium]